MEKKIDRLALSLFRRYCLDLQETKVLTVIKMALHMGVELGYTDAIQKLQSTFDDLQVPF